MSTFDIIRNKILNLKISNHQPRYIYLGNSEYRELRSLASTVAIKCEDEFMGIEVIRVSLGSHINVTGDL